MTFQVHKTGTQAMLNSLATAVPGHLLVQTDVAQAASELFCGRVGGFDRLRSVFDNAGIEKRYSACDVAWYTRPRDWRERNDVYIKVSSDLFRKAAGTALAAAQLEPGQVDTIVTVSSTGIATPTLEARQLNQMGFAETTRRVPVFGLGCAGGVTGLSLASRLAVAEPGSNVLLVVIELCTLSFQFNDTSKSNIVASALFGDGAGAVVISSRPRDPLGCIECSGEHTWPDTLDLMGWRVDANGLGVIFDRSIPDLVKNRMRSATCGFLASQGLALDDIGSFVFHPGGAKVLEAIEEVFELPQGELNKEREVLRNFGNMSAPTVLFVLEKALGQTQGKRHLISALGPGFTVTFATLTN